MSLRVCTDRLPSLLRFAWVFMVAMHSVDCGASGSAKTTEQQGNLLTGGSPGNVSGDIISSNGLTAIVEARADLETLTGVGTVTAVILSNRGG